MAVKRHHDTFDVIEERRLGTVVIDPAGTESPTLAAFRVIAENSDLVEDSSYSFPAVNGNTVRVTIEGSA